MTGDYRKDPEAISKLDERQYAVTQEAATEPPFDNEFWDKKEAGIYVDIVSGRTAVRVHQEVRQRLRVAQLHRSARARATWSRRPTRASA